MSQYGSAAVNKIAILGSGGDAPGMNPCIRAVTRSALEQGLEVWGVWDGYNGLVDHRIEQLTSRGVAGILQRGGSMIGAGRCPAFFDAATRQACADYLRGEGIEGLVVMGGDGSMNGARELHLLGVPTVVVPVTIDNDMRGTEITVGADTAINTAVEAIDRLRDTASAHQRAMIIEVMGRRSGYIAMMAGIATGAEMIITPERASELESIFSEMREMDARGKRHFIVVIAEGARWSAAQLTELINDAPQPLRRSVHGPGLHPARRRAEPVRPHPRHAHGGRGHRGAAGGSVQCAHRVAAQSSRHRGHRPLGPGARPVERGVVARVPGHDDVAGERHCRPGLCSV